MIRSYPCLRRKVTVHVSLLMVRSAHETKTLPKPRWSPSQAVFPQTARSASSSTPCISHEGQFMAMPRCQLRRFHRSTLDNFVPLLRERSIASASVGDRSTSHSMLRSGGVPELPHSIALLRLRPRGRLFNGLGWDSLRYPRAQNAGCTNCESPTILKQFRHSVFPRNLKI